MQRGSVWVLLCRKSSSKCNIWIFGSGFWCFTGSWDLIMVFRNLKLFNQTLSLRLELIHAVVCASVFLILLEKIELVDWRKSQSKLWYLQTQQRWVHILRVKSSFAGVWRKDTLLYFPKMPWLHVNSLRWECNKKILISYIIKSSSITTSFAIFEHGSWRLFRDKIVLTLVFYIHF